MSMYSKIAAVVSNVNDKGFAFAKFRNESIYIAPQVAKTAKTELQVGAEIILDAATTWNNAKGKEGINALHIYSVVNPAIDSGLGQLKWFSPEKAFGFIVILDGQFAGREARVTAATVKNCQFDGRALAQSAGMPMRVRVRTMGEYLDVMTMESDGEIIAAVKSLIASTDTDEAEEIFTEVDSADDGQAAKVAA